MPTNIGTGPQDIPLNQFLGEMAFMDNQIEFGTWDPQISQLGSHTRNDATSGGFYQRIGKMVYVTFSYNWTGRTNDGGYGVKINNLPWRNDTSYPVRVRGSAWVGGMEGVLPDLSTHPNRNSAGAYIDGTDIHFRVSCVDTNAGGEVSLNGSQATAQSGGYIYGGAVYITTGERFIA